MKGSPCDVLAPASTADSMSQPPHLCIFNSCTQAAAVKDGGRLHVGTRLPAQQLDPWFIGECFACIKAAGGRWQYCCQSGGPALQPRCVRYFTNVSPSQPMKGTSCWSSSLLPVQTNCSCSSTQQATTSRLHLRAVNTIDAAHANYGLLFPFQNADHDRSRNFLPSRRFWCAGEGSQLQKQTAIDANTRPNWCGHPVSAV